MSLPDDRFYAECFRLQRDAPDRFWLLCGAILRHALTHLETHPKTVGIEMVIARCMPPRAEGKVRSLRRHVGMGTGSFRGDLHTKEYFLGAESLAGHAATRQHGEMVPDTEQSQLPTVHVMDDERSAAAYPIMKEEKIAGVLIVSCSLPHYFSPERLTQLEIYADLLRLAFFDREYYPCSTLDLGLMPDFTIQRASFETFWQRVEAEYRRALREGALSDVAQAEERVRGMLEEELLRVGS
jgi:hypothetical protein